jgi:RNA polymerase sigma factor (sigma-70 family)
MMHTSMMLTDSDPTDLMRAIALKRDRNAFAIVFDSYAPKLKAFLMNGGLDGATAEELVQEVMLTVWQRADSFDPRLGGLSTWIFTIARNRRIDHYRRVQRAGANGLPEEPPPEPEPAADSLAERGERHNSLRAALRSLPPEQAEVLRLAFFEQKPHSVIAGERQLPLGTVKSRIRLALRALRRVLEADR